MNAKIFQILFYYYRLLHDGCEVTAHFPLAQAIHESANFTSHVYEVNNNCLGMMAPQSRDTTANNRGGKGYASYSSAMDGVSDYFFWLDAFGIKTDAQLEAHLKAGKYAADKAYLTKVNRVAAELKAAGSYISPTAILVGGTAAAVATAVAAGAGVAHLVNS